MPTFRGPGREVIGESAHGTAGPCGTDPGMVRTVHGAFRPAAHDPQGPVVRVRWDIGAPRERRDSAVGVALRVEEARRIVQEPELKPL